MPEQRNAQPPPIQPLGVDLFYDSFTGAYRLDPRGDLDLHAGIDALKKRVIRRLITTPGSFYHLPDYGVGLECKEPFNSTNLGRIQAEIIRQLRQEEEILELEVQVASPAPDVLVVKIRARTAAGRPFGLALEQRPEGPVVRGG